MILLRAGLGPFSLSLPLWTGLGPWSFFSLSLSPSPAQLVARLGGGGPQRGDKPVGCWAGPLVLPPSLFVLPPRERPTTIATILPDRPPHGLGRHPPLSSLRPLPARALPSAVVCHPSRSGGQRSQRRIPFVLRRTCAIGVARKHTMPRALPAAEGAKVAGPTSNADPPLTSLGLPHQS